MPRLFRPYRYVPMLPDVDPQHLRAEGVRGVILDLDDTLVGYRHLAPLPPVVSWVNAALAAGLRMIIVSNNSRAWVHEIATGLGLQFVHKAKKPLPLGFKQAIAALGLDKREIVVIGDQVFTDLLGAKLLGLRVILTNPLVEPIRLPMRLLRFVERLVLSIPEVK